MGNEDHEQKVVIIRSKRVVPFHKGQIWSSSILPQAWALVFSRQENDPQVAHSKLETGFAADHIDYDVFQCG